MIRVAALTDPGQQRSRNEDTIALPGVILVDRPMAAIEWSGDVPRGSVFAVVDGMGGHAGGSEASALVARELAPGCREVEPALQQIHRALYAEARHKPELSAMGATVVGVHFSESHATFFNVGDARAYLHVDGFSRVISVDDSGADPGSVSQSLGGTPEPVSMEVHTFQTGTEQAWRALLCSDGLSDVVGFQEIQDCLTMPSPGAAVMALIDLANSAGAPDNVSAVVIDAG